MAIPGIQVDPGTLAGLRFRPGKQASVPAGFLLGSPANAIIPDVHGTGRGIPTAQGTLGGLNFSPTGSTGPALNPSYTGPTLGTAQEQGGGLTGGAHPQKPKGAGKNAVSPFDPEYYQNVANYLFKTNNAVAGDQQGETDERTAMQGALAALAYAQPRAALGLEEKANLNGGLYSSAYGQQQGDLESQYGTKASGVANQGNEKLADLISKIAGLRGGVPLYENEQALASAERLAAAAAKNPALGQPKTPLVAPEKPGGLTESSTGESSGRLTGAARPLEAGNGGRFDPLALERGVPLNLEQGGRLRQSRGRLSTSDLARVLALRGVR